MGFVVAAMSLPNVLIRLREDVTVIAPGDRSDLLPALLILAHQSGVYPQAVGGGADRRLHPARTRWTG